MKKVLKIVPLFFISFSLFASEGLSFWPKSVLLIGHIVDILVFVFVLYYFFKKPIGDAIKNQKNELIRQIKEAEEKEKEADRKLKEIEEKMSKLGEEVESILKKAEEFAHKEKEKIINRAKEEAEKIKKMAEMEIENKLTSAKNELKKYIVELSSKRAEEIIKSSITDSEIDRTIENYFKELEG